jgi:glyoxylase-like metal-dependent hydrolase (beta-lactamase superfamily II)
LASGSAGGGYARAIGGTAAVVCHGHPRHVSALDVPDPLGMAVEVAVVDGRVAQRLGGAALRRRRFRLYLIERKWR